MGWDTPAWLWLLVPFAALVILTLRAYRPIRAVPFLDLWPLEEVRRENRRAWRRPPLPILLLLAAMFLAIFAMARPWLSTSPRISRLNIVLDRGVTMLAGGRYAQATTSLSQLLSPLLDPEAEIRIVDPLAPDLLVGPAALQHALDRPLTALDLRARVASAVDSALTNGWPTVVVSDSAEPRSDIAVARPAGRFVNVGIVAAVANRGECWLTLRNDSPAERVVVSFVADDRSDRHELDLPPKGEQRKYILKCPDVWPLTVEIQSPDDLQDDNTWWLLPPSVPGRLTAANGLPEWLRHFVATYAEQRPANSLSASVTVTTSPIQAARTLSVGLGDERIIVPAGQPSRDHPILANVRLPSTLLAGPALPSGDWEVLWHIGGRPLLAVSEANRSVWIGFRPPSDISPDYLILLTNAVDFCCGIETATSGPQSLDEAWEAADGGRPPMPGLRAGLYRKGDRYLAVNVTAPQIPAIADPKPLSESIAAMASAASRIQLATWLWLSVCAFAAGAAVLARPPGRH